jgi:tetratricopeptide (TPR) repeat protein
VTADRYGLPISTASAAALDTYDRAVHALLGWDRDALDLFHAAARLDPGMAVAHAGAAVCLFLDERFTEARAAAQAARAAVAGQTTRERDHVEALALLVTARPDEAEPPMRAYLGAYPRDLVVAQRLYFIWFWQGRFPEMLALTERLLPVHGGNSFLLGLHAFALEEADRLPEAERAAERAMAANPRDAWAVHALAHTLHEAARFDDGINRLPPAIHPCTHLNWFRDHLLWHLALLHLGKGHHERAEALARRVFERAPSAIAGELHDSISLLWRLDLCGRPVGPRWRPFAEIARDRLNRQGLLFHAVHLAMALAAAGDWTTAERQRAMLRDRAAKDVTGLVRDVVLPLAEGMQAFPAGDDRQVIARIEPLRSRIVEIGGSRAQRAVFHDTLLAACFRAGDTERARRLVAERAGARRVPLSSP